MQPSPAMLLAFCASAGLLLLAAWRLAAWLGTNARDRYWLLIAGIAMQLGAATTVTSVPHLLTPTGWWLGQIIITGAVLVWTPRRPLPGLPTLPVSTIDWLIVAGIASVILLSLTLQILVPVFEFDARMYHASRVLHWIQHQSALPFPSHNDRHSAFGFGGELFFLWPVLLTKSELVGRLVSWTAYPAAITGMYLLLRQATLGRRPAALGALLLAATPIALRSSVSLGTDLWLAVFVLGTSYWVLRCFEGDSTSATAGGFALLFLLLSINTKYSALALALPVLGYLFWRCRPRRHLALAGVAGLLLSGLIIPWSGNILHAGHPLGPANFRAAHSVSFTLEQLYIHAVRLPFLLFDLPWVGSVWKVQQKEGSW